MMDGYDMNGWGWAVMVVWSVIAVGVLGVVAWLCHSVGTDQYQRRRAALERGQRERTPRSIIHRP
jgi:hypothetical protein